MSRFDPFPTLETPRLVLRELVPGDLDVVVRIQQDPRVVRYLGRATLTVEQVKERLELVASGIREGTSVRWGLSLRDGGELAGTAGFWRWNQEHRWAEIGYDLAPERWGSGLMTEALGVVLRYGFDAMGLHRVEANTDPENKGSRRVLEKLGFVQEALVRENWYHEGRFLDSAFYGLLRRDFDRARPEGG